MESNDHDLLIQVNTKLGMLIDNQGQYFAQLVRLSERVAAVESKDRADSEKIKAISNDVQRSLDNHVRLTALEANYNNLLDEIKEMRKKSNLFDSLNAALAGIAGTIGFLFGPK